MHFLGTPNRYYDPKMDLSQVADFFPSAPGGGKEAGQGYKRGKGYLF